MILFALLAGFDERTGFDFGRRICASFCDICLDTGIEQANYLRCKYSCVDGPGLADCNRPDRDAAGHLNDG